MPPPLSWSVVRAKHAPFVAIKVCVSAALLTWLAHKVEPDAMRAAMAGLDGGMVVAALLLHFAAYAVASMRWWLLLRHLQGPVPFSAIAPAYYLGVFCNNFLPTGVGGDLARTAVLKLEGLGLRVLVSSAIADRAIGLIVVLIIGATCALLSPEVPIDASGRTLLVAIAASVIVGVSLLLSQPMQRLLDELLHRYAHTRRRRALLQVLELTRSFRDDRRLVVSASALSLANQAFVIGTYVVLAAALRLDLAIVTFCAVIPVVFLASSLPISIGGLGVREGTLVTLLGAAGVAAQPALALSLAYLLVLWTTSLPGLGALFLRPPPPKAPLPTS
jgi:glycosyltransferase 2 family protein